MSFAAWVTKVMGSHAFVVNLNTSRNLYVSARRNVASGRLQEKEGLFGCSVVELLNVVHVIPPNSNNLQLKIMKMRVRIDLFMGWSIAWYLAAVSSEVRHLERWFKMDLLPKDGKFIYELR